ncbi:energy transducer TonB [Caenimonas terrae]|uniref:Energy transducer TonB n=1 Tax=Caenimonas terrae TaxID=696074 RepID=A0ABW0NCE7_9BURK
MNRRRYPGTEPSRRLTGWIVVVLLHIVILWALITGTARKGLEIIKKPLEAAVIQEVIIPPPPPPPPPPPKQIVKQEPQAPKVEAPPPPFVPPPEVAPPVSNAPAIVSMPTPPPAPPVIAPPAPPAPPAPKPSTGRAEIGIACPTQVKPEMPRKAIQEGTEGVVRAQALIRDGVVKEVTILSGPRIFHAAVRNAMLQYKCVSEPGDVLAPQEFVFKVDN